MKSYKKFFFIIFFFLQIYNLAFAKDKFKQLIAKKHKLKKKIKLIQSIIQKNLKKKKNSLGKLKEILLQIEYKKNLITIIDKQIKFINQDFQKNLSEIDILSKKLKTYKLEYSDLIYKEMKLMNSLKKILFIFSAQSFNEMFLRTKYINQINKVRKDFLLKIKNTENLLKGRVKNAKAKKIDLLKLYDQYKKEYNNFLKIKIQQQEIIKSLNNYTKKLRKDLKIKLKFSKKIEDLIKNTIKNNNTGVKRKFYDNTKNKNFTLNKSFYKNKGKLPWPVKKGFISKRFGIHRHPVLTNVRQENLGIDIRTSKNSEALCVFDGVVEAVAFIPFFQQLIIVKHNNYYTVYTKLKTVFVKVGQLVKSYTPLGIIFTNKEGITELQFQICDKRGMKLNPAKWIK